MMDGSRMLGERIKNTPENRRFNIRKNILHDTVFRRKTTNNSLYASDHFVNVSYGKLYTTSYEYATAITLLSTVRYILQR